MTGARIFIKLNMRNSEDEGVSKPFTPEFVLSSNSIWDVVGFLHPPAFSNCDPSTFEINVKARFMIECVRPI